MKKQQSLWRGGFVLAALLGLLATPTLLAAAPLELHLHDPETRELYGRLEPGRTLTLGVGETLRVAAFTSNEGRRRIYPRARYNVVSGHRHVDVELLGRDDASGTLLLRGVRPGETVVGYQLLTELRAVDAGDRQGRFRVVVVPGARYGTGAVDDGHPWIGADQREAWEVVDALYRGILLRSPEDAQSERVRTIQAGGWQAAERVALEIADSTESRDLSHQVDAEQRVAALYRHLVGRERSQVTTFEWARMVRLAEMGRVSEVVSELVRGDEFAQRFGLGDRYGWLR